jgi:hypothetical protein
MIDSKGRDFGCFGLAKARMLPGKRKAGASSRSSLQKYSTTKITKVQEKFAGKFMGRAPEIILTVT